MHFKMTYFNSFIVTRQSHGVKHKAFSFRRVLQAIARNKTAKTKVEKTEYTTQMTYLIPNRGYDFEEIKNISKAVFLIWTRLKK